MLKSYKIVLTRVARQPPCLPSKFHLFVFFQRASAPLAACTLGKSQRGVVIRETSKKSSMEPFRALERL
jgi:hypothetical protein